MAGFGMGVGAFPMMGVQGMGVPMGMVNQAAFAQQNVMGMGVMGAVPSSASVRAPPAQVGSMNIMRFTSVTNGFIFN